MGADCCRGPKTRENNQSGSGITPDTVFHFV